MSLLRRIKNLWHLSGLQRHGHSIEWFPIDEVGEMSQKDFDLLKDQPVRKMAEIIKKKVDPIEEIING